MKPVFHLLRVTLRTVALAALLGGMLGGCGQKGPLVLPSKADAPTAPANK